MNILLYIKLALISIRSAKVRSFLTILGIIIGIASVVIMIGLGNGTRAAIEESFASIGTNTLTIYPTGDSGRLVSGNPLLSDALDADDVKTIKEDKSLSTLLEYISPEFQASDQVIAGKYNEFSMMFGSESELAAIKSFTFKAGNFYTQEHVANNSKVAVLGANVAERLFKNEYPIGKSIRIKSQTLIVIGVMNKIGGISFYPYDDSVLMPITTAQNLVFNQSSYNTITIKVRDREQVDAAKAQLEYSLAFARKELDEGSRTFMVQSSNQILNEVNNVLGGFTALMSAIAGISLVVGAIGITNTMIATIGERTKEIGLRKAVGAMDSDIRMQFLVESTVLTMTGGIVGVLLALVLGFIFQRVLQSVPNLGGFGEGFRVIIDLNAAALAALISSTVGVISGLYPAVKASRLNPIEALRYE